MNRLWLWGALLAASLSGAGCQAVMDPLVAANAMTQQANTLTSNALQTCNNVRNIAGKPSVGPANTVAACPAAPQGTAQTVDPQAAVQQPAADHTACYTHGLEFEVKGDPAGALVAFTQAQQLHPCDEYDKAVDRMKQKIAAGAAAQP